MLCRRTFARRVGVLAVATLVAGLTAASPAIAIPEAGPYADNALESTGSKLEFAVNEAGTQIDPGATLQAGFPCAKGTVRVTKPIPVDASDDSFSYRGRVRRMSGKPAGELRWSGAWTGPWDVDGTVRLRQGDCSSRKIDFAAMEVLPIFGPIQAAPGSPGCATISWPVVQGASYYYVHRSTVAGGPYPSYSYATGTSYPDCAPPEETGGHYYFVRAFDSQGEPLANSNEVYAPT